MLPFRLLSKLPLPSLYRLGTAIYFIAGRVLRWRHALAMRNLAAAFPGRSEQELVAIIDQSYRNLGDLVAEILWAAGASRAELGQRVEVENADLVNEELRAGRSVLLMTAHFCNWEWQVLAGNLHLDRPMCPVYKPQRVGAIDRFLRETRSRFGGEPIPHKTLTRVLLRRRSEAQVYAMVADQTPTVGESKHWSCFLGRDTAFFVGADAIARILQAPVFFVHMRRVGRGRYVMGVSKLTAPPYAKGESTDVIERYVRALEDEVRSSPPDWLWIHNKWKYAPPAPAAKDASVLSR